MLARRLLLIYLVEACIYLAGAVWAWSADVAGGWIFAGLILAPLLTRLLIVIFMFGVAWWFHSPWPADLPRVYKGLLLLFLREYMILVALYTGFMFLERLLRRQLSGPVVQGGDIPVVFIHGFFCNAGYWWSLLRYLRTRGRNNLFTLNLEPIHGSIDRFAKQLQKRVEDVLAETGHEQVILVGHSMGGLVSRVYYRRHGGAGRVARIITLGSPHQGTRHAHYSRAHGALNMRVDSQWLVDLAKLEEAGGAEEVLPITSIYTLHDNIVSPQNSAELIGARNIMLAGMGHLALGWDRSVQEMVSNELATDLGADRTRRFQKIAEEPPSKPLSAPSNESMPS